MGRAERSRVSFVHWYSQRLGLYLAERRAFNEYLLNERTNEPATLANIWGLHTLNVNGINIHYEGKLIPNLYLTTDFLKGISKY